MAMRGIILAGGAGSRLHPLTLVVSKQLQPIYDKPMIYYPLSTLMLAGIREYLVISTPSDLPRFRELLGDGSHLGISFSYAEQPMPGGISQSFLIGSDFIGGQPVALILGDNLFHGDGLATVLQEAVRDLDGATIFGYQVKDPEQYGVVQFDKKGKVMGIEEKPKRPKSKFAVPGLYFYDNSVVERARALVPSPRGELEITDLNMAYQREGKLNVHVLGRGTAWLDTGTHQSLLRASNFVEAVESRQGLKIGCIEEVAYRMGFIGLEGLAESSRRLGKSAYGEYLREMVNGEEPADRSLQQIMVKSRNTNKQH